MFAEDLAAFFTDFAETVTVAGASVQAIHDTETVVQLGEALAVAPTLLVLATVAAAAGDACVVRGVTHKIRQVRLQPPNGSLKQLVLVRG